MGKPRTEGANGNPGTSAQPGRLARSWSAFVTIFRQGTDPDRLAECVAWGALLGMLPLPGLNSALCAAVAIRRELNMGLIQAVNWLILVPQIALFLPMAWLGAKILGQSPIPLTREEIGPLLKAGPVTVVKTLGTGLAGAIAVWALIGIPLAWVAYRILRAVLRRTVAASAERPESGQGGRSA
jgi:hypothetical protein